MQRHRQRFSETDKITVVFGTKRNLPRFAISLLCFICYIFFHQQVIVWMYEWRDKPLWSAIRGAFCGTFCSLHFPSTVSKQSSEGQDLEMESDSKPPIAPGCRHMSEKYRKHHKHMGKHISHTQMLSDYWVCKQKNLLLLFYPLTMFGYLSLTLLFPTFYFPFQSI